MLSPKTQSLKPMIIQHQNSWLLPHKNLTAEVLSKYLPPHLISNRTEVFSNLLRPYNQTLPIPQHLQTANINWAIKFSSVALQWIWILQQLQICSKHLTLSANSFLLSCNLYAEVQMQKIIDRHLLLIQQCEKMKQAKKKQTGLVQQNFRKSTNDRKSTDMFSPKELPLSTT